VKDVWCAMETVARRMRALRAPTLDSRAYQISLRVGPLRVRINASYSASARRAAVTALYARGGHAPPYVCSTRGRSFQCAERPRSAVTVRRCAWGCAPARRAHWVRARCLQAKRVSKVLHAAGKRVRPPSRRLDALTTHAAHLLRRTSRVVAGGYYGTSAVHLTPCGDGAVYARDACPLRCCLSAAVRRCGASC